jgi:hypothetical protein
VSRPPLEPTVLLDGAVPRDSYERCAILLDYAAMWQSGRVEELRASLDQSTDETEWHYLEDDIIMAINEVLPHGWWCCLHPDDPGTVVITEADPQDQNTTVPDYPPAA